MSVLHLSIGVILLVTTVVDLLWTTLWVEGGAGPLTKRVMRWTWKLIRRIGVRWSRVRTLAGPVILLIGILMWVTFLWTGWTLVFAGAESALRDTIDGGPISWVERVYFVGYTMFTMGNGDFVPRDGVWQLATAATTASGMLFVTLIITYVLSVLDAVTQKRSFATDVSGLGLQGETVVRASWDGEAFTGLDLLLNTFSSELNELTANHKAYPILHYFYTEQREAAAVLSVAVLNDALTLWQFGVPAENRPSRALLENTRSALQTYLETVGESYVTQSETTPPAPDLAHLREAGVPTASDEEFDNSLDELTAQRRMLLGLVEADARRWPGSQEG